MPLRHVAFLCKRTVDCQPFYNESQQTRSFSGEVVSNCTFCFKSQIKTPHLKWPYRRQKNLWTALYTVCCYNENNLTMTYNMSVFHSTVHCCYDENNLTMTYNRPVFHSTVHCCYDENNLTMTYNRPVFHSTVHCCYDENNLTMTYNRPVFYSTVHCCYDENNLTMTYNRPVFHSTVHCCYDENNLTMTYNRPVFHSTVHCCYDENNLTMTYNRPVFHSTVHCCYDENNLTMTYNRPVFHSTVHCCYDENNLTMTYNRPVFHSTVHCLLLRWEQSMTHMPVFLQHWTSSVVTMRTIWLWRICQGESINWKGNDMLPNHNIKAVNWGRGIIIKDGKHACFSLKQKYNTVISSNAKCFMPSMSRAIGDCTVYNLTGGHFTQMKSICFQISTNYTMCSCILWYTDLLN